MDGGDAVDASVGKKRRKKKKKKKRGGHRKIRALASKKPQDFQVRKASKPDPFPKKNLLFKDNYIINVNFVVLSIYYYCLYYVHTWYK